MKFTRVHYEMLLLIILIVFSNNIIFFGHSISIFPDESRYISSSLVLPLADADMPHYLYYLLYSITGWAGEYFADAARLLNSLFFLAAAPFIYSLARTGCSRGQALFLTALCMLMPRSLYIFYFMPEIPYSTVFWVLAWFLVRYRFLPPWRYGLTAGMIIAAAALIKVHAVFWTAGLCLFLVLSYWNRDGWFRQSFTAVFFAAVGFIAVKFGISFAFAGWSGLSLFGKAYNTLAYDVSEAIPPAGFAWYTSLGLAGHILVLCLLFGVPLAVSGRVFFGPSINRNAPAVRLTGIMILSFLVPLMGVSAVFGTMSHYISGDTIPSEWKLLQIRYYNFLFPGFVLLTGLFVFGDRKDQEGPRLQKFVLLTIILTALAGIFSNYFGFAFFPLYSPEVPFFRYSWHWMSLTLAAAVIPTVFLIISQRLGVRIYIFAAAPLLFTLSSISTKELSVRGGNAFEWYSLTGVFLTQYLGREKDALAGFDTMAYLGERVRYYAGRENVDYYGNHPSGEINSLLLPQKYKWIYTVGYLYPPREMVRHMSVIYSGNDQELPILLHRLADYTYSIDFGDPNPVWPVLDIAEENAALLVQYALPLPSRFRIRVVTENGENAAEAALALRHTPFSIRRDSRFRIFPGNIRQRVYHVGLMDAPRPESYTTEKFTPAVFVSPDGGAVIDNPQMARELIITSGGGPKAVRSIVIQPLSDPEVYSYIFLLASE